MLLGGLSAITVAHGFSIALVNHFSNYFLDTARSGCQFSDKITYC